MYLGLIIRADSECSLSTVSPDPSALLHTSHQDQEVQYLPGREGGRDHHHTSMAHHSTCTVHTSTLHSTHGHCNNVVSKNVSVSVCFGLVGSHQYNSVQYSTCCRDLLYALCIIFVYMYSVYVTQTTCIVYIHGTGRQDHHHYILTITDYRLGYMAKSVLL